MVVANPLQVRDFARATGALAKTDRVDAQTLALFGERLHPEPRTLLGAWPELGQLTHKPIAALAGVAPFARDSGTWRGQRHVRGGRAPVRRALYMAALVATRCNPIIKDFCQRLLAVGKATTVALTACMRTLLTILTAMVRSNTAWRRTTA